MDGAEANHARKEPWVPSITAVAPVIHAHLTTTAEAAARQTGCVQRVRQFSGATLVQTCVLGFLEAPDASLSELCQMAALRGVTITPQGLAQRFTPALAATLQLVLEALVREVVIGPAVTLPLLQRFGQVWLLDTTVLSLPDELAPLWAGCGGQAQRGQAALKVALDFDLVTGQLAGPVLQAGRAADRASVLTEQAHPPGSLRLQDLGFFRLSSFREATRRGEAWLSRLMAGTRVWSAEGRCWSQAELLAHQPAAVVDLSVRLGVKEQLPARLLAVRVPPEVAATRRERLEREARKKGQPVSAERLALADWTVLITNLPPTALTVAEALALVRARWQIEQLFDLWKTHGGLDRSRSQQPWRVLCELYAKLIALVIQHWLIVQGDWQAPARSLVKAARVVRHCVHWLAAVFDRPHELRQVLRTLHRLLLQAGRLNPRKQAPNTYQRLLHPSAIGLT
jgi:hypothetical protein